MSDSSTDDDPDRDIVDDLFAEIDGGRLTLDEAAAKYPHLKKRLEDALSIPRLVKSTHAGTVHKPPENFGEYRVVYEIARGGMGIVYRAYHERLHRDVAVKTIGDVRDPVAARERFQREQTALACLHQTHIVPIYAAGSDAAGEYFVMPYIDGASLDRVLKAWGTSSNGRTEIETLFSLVQSTSNETAERSTSAFVSTNGGSRSSRDRAERRTVATAQTPAADPPKSDSYFRSAGTVVANAADALEHAHRRSIFHRDLKPKNIMLGIDGRLWIIDFGLAAFLPQENDAELLSNGTTGTLTKGTVGTWSYMAPEQFALKADARTDVWGLAVTLYEILTLRCAYQHRSKDWQQAAATPPPQHPIAMNPATPPDLAEICWKGMAQDPAKRYQSAGELAEDLRRWLRDEPVKARERGIGERMVNWIVKHRAWTAAAVLFLISIALIIGLQWQSNKLIAEQRWIATAEHLEKLHDPDWQVGWSKRLLKETKEAAAIRKDPRLRDAAVAAFSGVDFELVHRTLDYGASSAAYDPTGKRLALGGTEERGGKPGSPAKVWNLNEPAPTLGKANGSGLVAYLRDGSPVQLTATPRGELTVAHIITGEILRKLDGLKGSQRKDVPHIAISPNGDVVAASFPDENITALWTLDGRFHRVPVGAVALTLSRDGSLLATGAPSGVVSIWSAAEGRRLASYPLSESAIQTLAFSSSARLKNGVANGRIAAGWVGRFGVVDLSDGRMQCMFESRDEVSRQLTFDPEDRVIAADGVLFDAATGYKLLNVSGLREVLVFSPDGREICNATASGFVEPELTRLSMKKLVGPTLLYGLNANVARFAMSRNGRFLAALSHSWRLGVWNLESGALVQLLRVPEGPFIGNADVALSDDGSTVVAASGDVACGWSTSTGESTGRWKLPPGLSNGLAFRPKGELVLARFELKSKRDYPMNPLRFPEHPRTVRVWKLGGPTPELLCEVDHLAKHIYGVALSADGERFLVDGRSKENARNVVLYDARTGKEIRSYPLTHQRDYNSLRVDPAGTLMSFLSAYDPEPVQTQVIRAVDGSMVNFDSRVPVELGSNGDTWIESIQETDVAKYYLFERGRAGPLFQLPQYNVAGVLKFSHDGRRLAYPTRSGAVAVIDRDSVKQFLDGLGLGW